MTWQGTPGPWHISDFEPNAGGTDRVVMGADGYGVAWLHGRSVEEHETDAHAIAAVPQLVEALLAVDDMFSMPGRINKTTVRDKVRDALRAAKVLP